MTVETTTVATTVIEDEPELSAPAEKSAAPARRNVRGLLQQRRLFIAAGLR
jgi:hypothetical protein